MSTLTQMANEIDTIKNEIVSCHGKLKSKLESGGISTVPEDKLSVLIDKIEINGSIIKIKTGSELPLEVENNTIFIQDIETIGKIYIQEEDPILNENDIYMNNSPGNVKGVKLEIGNSKVNNIIYINYIKQKIGEELVSKKAWIGLDNAWIEIVGDYILFSESLCELGSERKENWILVDNDYDPRLNVTFEIRKNPNKIHLSATSTISGLREDFSYRLKNPIDLTKYNYLCFNINKRIITASANASVGVLSKSNSLVATKKFSNGEADNELIKIDISKIKGEHYLFLGVGVNNSSNSSIIVDKIYVTGGV